MNTTFLRGMAFVAVFALVAIAPGAVLANDGAKAHARTDTLVQLQSNGSALVRGAEVTSVSDNTIHADVTLGGVTLSYAIVTDGDTDFITQNGGGSDFSDINDGDTISFSGELTGASTVEADVVKDWSRSSDTRVAVTGTVKEVNSGSFVLSGTRFGDITVDVDSDTEFSQGDLSDLSVGEHIAASGTYSSDNDTLDADKVSGVRAEKQDDFGAKLKGWFKTHFNFGPWKK